MSVETVGKQIDTIEVKINYRIIELFSAGLYSSPNKTFEELVCNSYDAFADKVCVYVPSDLTANAAYIWVCDNGESMDQQGLKELWNIGISPKRMPEREAKRMQIGRFGIGKLATYVLANKLTYICKKDGRYIATTMDYGRIRSAGDKLELVEREIEEKEAKDALKPYLYEAGKYRLSFDLFGDNAAPAWTFALLTELKTKAMEIKEGRLKWVLRTALPHNPGFRLYYNDEEIESSKISMKVDKSWVIGKNDETAKKMELISKRVGDNFFVDFPNLKGVYGQFDLHEDSLLEGKSADLGRSHGIFLMVRGRLVNLDDPLLGMEAFSHGVFNRTRIVIHADELDENLTSTREAIKESPPFEQLKDYLKKKINNEIKKYYFEKEEEDEKKSNISYRLSQTSLTLSKRPLYIFAKKFYNNEILNPILIEKPPLNAKSKLLADLAKELSTEESIIKGTEWSVLSPSDPIAKLDLITGIVKINLIHPFIANYGDMPNSLLPLQFVAITEVLTEAHMYELGIDETIINDIIRRRDSTLRKLSLSDRKGAPIVAQMLKDAISDPTGLEDAVLYSFITLGFEATKIGGSNEPDGQAQAILGIGDNNQSNNYSLTYDAKSSSKDRIKAETAKLAEIKRHQKAYNANFSVVIAVDFEGADDPHSAICEMANQQKVTVMRARDLIRLLLFSTPHQIGLSKLRNLFQNCYAPYEVTEWINNVENEPINEVPLSKILEKIYDLQFDTETPDISSIRRELIHDGLDISKANLKSIIESLNVFCPGFISLDGEKVGIQGIPSKVMDHIHGTIQKMPQQLQQKYVDAFYPKES